MRFRAFEEIFQIKIKKLLYNNTVDILRGKSAFFQANFLIKIFTIDCTKIVGEELNSMNSRLL